LDACFVVRDYGGQPLAFFVGDLDRRFGFAHGSDRNSHATKTSLRIQHLCTSASRVMRSRYRDELL
jgi:hypothetical protein